MLSPKTNIAVFWGGYFWSPRLKDDKSLGMRRVEALCKKCGAHSGHAFDDGPRAKGGKHYCINSVCLELDKINH